MRNTIKKTKFLLLALATFASVGATEITWAVRTAEVAAARALLTKYQNDDTLTVDFRIFANSQDGQKKALQDQQVVAITTLFEKAALLHELGVDLIELDPDGKSFGTNKGAITQKNTEINNVIKELKTAFDKIEDFDPTDADQTVPLNILQCFIHRATLADLFNYDNIIEMNSLNITGLNLQSFLAAAEQQASLKLIKVLRTLVLTKFLTTNETATNKTLKELITAVETKATEDPVNQKKMGKLMKQRKEVLQTYPTFEQNQPAASGPQDNPGAGEPTQQDYKDLQDQIDLLATTNKQPYLDKFNTLQIQLDSSLIAKIQATDYHNTILNQLTPVQCTEINEIIKSEEINVLVAHEITQLTDMKTQAQKTLDTFIQEMTEKAVKAEKSDFETKLNKLLQDKPNITTKLNYQDAQKAYDDAVKVLQLLDNINSKTSSSSQYIQDVEIAQKKKNYYDQTPKIS